MKCISCGHEIVNDNGTRKHRASNGALSYCCFECDCYMPRVKNEM